MYIKCIVENNGIKPTKAHESDAGFDLYSCEDTVISPRSNYTFDTNVRLLIPDGLVGFLKSKSGLNVNKCIVSEGVIDAGYTGTIRVKLYNHSDNSVVIKEGDKISQIVFLPTPTITLRAVSSFDTSTDRGDKGFGSSGR